MIVENFVHYSEHPLPLPLVSYPQEAGFKPMGLWITPKGQDDNWHAWCWAEGFRLDKLVVETSIHFDSTNVLYMKSAYEIDAFTEEFRPKDLGLMADFQMRWDLVAEKYKGLVIDPYIWSRRLNGDAMWYYSWDCASGCIWDVSAITKIGGLSCT